jgi:hypothetical protein
MQGSPGAGKSMLVRRLTTIPLAMILAEVLATTHMHRVLASPAIASRSLRRARVTPPAYDLGGGVDRWGPGANDGRGVAGVP